MNNNLLNIENIRNKIINKQIDWTKHCLNRLNQRNISINDVKNVIYSGIIIEHYYDDYPYPSCLILGYGIDKKILHIVCGISEGILHMITAYYPDSNRWEKDMKIRRKK